MQENDDIVLLRQFAESNSDEAFTTLVARHINLVYSVALRHVDHAHQAEEITQAVFIILVRKARQLRHAKALSSWLFQTTRLTAANFMRSEIRRAHREQEAHMQSLSHESETEVWSQVAPLLDDAVASLNENDRRAILLRFYEGKNLREVGGALGTSEDAAFQRTNRAVEKLRKFFGKRGFVVPAAALAATLSANSVHAAPTGLTTSATSAALTGSSLAAAALSEATLKLMTWLKVKFALGIGAAVLLAGGAVTVAVSDGNGGGSEAKGILKQVEKKYAALSSYSETTKTVSESFMSKGRGGSSAGAQSIKLARPNFYRVEELSRPDWFALWSVGDGKFWMMLNTNFYATPDEQIGADLLYIIPTGIVPSAFFAKRDRNVLAALAKSSDLARKPNEKVGGVDCYALSGSPRMAVMSGMTMTVWIGKIDFLIHQVRAILPVTGSKIPYTNVVVQTHENISVNFPFSNADFVHEIPAGLKPFDSFPFPDNSK